MDYRHADLKIAERLLDGDEGTFNAVFEAYFPRLYRAALARVGGDADEAKDIVQQTFCKVFERLDSYRGEASLYGWMCQIMRNTIVDRIRKRQTEGLHFEIADDDSSLLALAASLRATNNDEPETDLKRIELLTLIQATLDHLPTHYGDVLELKYVDELSVKQIAQRLDIGPKAAESLLTRARNAFKDAIVSIGGSADILPRDIVATVER